jgi:Protein of unknown function (DUF2867)
MTVCEITPDVDKSTLLAGAQFIDAFSIMVDGGALDARHAAERMVTRQPRWAATLLALRNILVAPFGLKTSGTGLATSEKMIGIFPIVSETRDRLVAGFNDKHLDFRLVVDVAASGRGQRVTATTLVLTHNWLGRTYLAVILPFHRLIVPAMLRRVAG